jgi:hypothetical protein
MSEARTEDRLGRLEQDVKATMARLEPMRFPAGLASPQSSALRWYVGF